MEHSKRASRIISPREGTGERHTLKLSPALPEIGGKLHGGLLSFLPNFLIPPFTDNDHIYLTLQPGDARGSFLQPAQHPSRLGLALVDQLPELGKIGPAELGENEDLNPGSLGSESLHLQTVLFITSREARLKNQTPPCHCIASSREGVSLLHYFQLLEQEY